MEPPSDEELAALLMRTRKKPLSFAFGLGSTPENSVIVLHRKLPPDKLYKQMRMRSEVTSKGAFGIASSEGLTITLTCHRTLSGLKRHVKTLFKQKGLSWKPKVVEGEEKDEPKKRA